MLDLVGKPVYRFSCVAAHITVMTHALELAHYLIVSYLPLFPVPPFTISVAGNQQIIANGQNWLTLTCTTDTANPRATVMWKNGNTLITSGVTQSDSAGAYGGRVTVGQLKFQPTRDMDGDVIECSGRNVMYWYGPMKNSTTLDLKCKSIFQLLCSC